MGLSSSQPVDDLPKSTNASTVPNPVDGRVPRYSPSMDDQAASQQLLNEELVAEQALGLGKEATLANDAIEISSPAPRGRASKRKRMSKKERSTQAPSEFDTSKQPLPVAPRSYTLADLQAFTENDDAPNNRPASPLNAHASGGPVTVNHIEVPDSQPAPTSPTHTSPPLSASRPRRDRRPKGNRQRKSDPCRPSLEQGDTRFDRESPGSFEGREIAMTARKRKTGETMGTSLSSRQRRTRKQKMREHSEDVDNNTEVELINRSNGSSRETQDVETSGSQAATLEAHSQPNAILNPDTSIIVEDSIQIQDLNNSLAYQESSPKKKKSSKKVGNIGMNDRSAPVRSLILPTNDSNTVGNTEDLRESVDKSEATTEPIHQMRRRKELLATPKGKTPMTSVADSRSNMPLETPSSHHMLPAVSSPLPQDSVKKRQYKSGRKPPRLSEARIQIRKSNVDPTNTVTAAERALNTVRELHHPPNLQTSGEYSQDEEELIRRAIRDYQERKGLDTTELVDIIQWTDDTKDVTMHRHKSDRTIIDTQDDQESTEFWEEMKLINLNRKFESVRNHIRSQYHVFKSGGWTKEEDEQLKKMYELYPKRWKLISQAMGDRSMHDVHNRWRDYLQHGDNRNTSTWSPDEESLLVRAITIVLQRDEDYRAETGKPPLIEYSNKDINWAQVCSEMNHTRSRLQSSVKWTKMKARNPPPQIHLIIKPREPLHPDRQEMPTPTPKKRGRPRKSECFSATEEGRSTSKHGKSHAKRISMARNDKNKSTKQLKISRKLKGSETSSSHDEDGQQTQLRQRTPISRESSMVGMLDLNQMRWGDKFDLIEAIWNCEKESQESIDWHDVAATMKHSWSIRTLQAALQELLETIRDREVEGIQTSFREDLGAILEFLEIDHGLELKDRYDPYAEVQPDEELDFVEINDDVEGSMLANLPNTKRKRRIGTQTDSPRSRSTSVKRRKTQLVSSRTTPKTFKSAEVITDSDDAESGLEP